MALTKPICWSLIVLGVLTLVVFGPLALIMGSNLVGGFLDLTLTRTPNLTELDGRYTLDFHPFGMVWDEDHEREVTAYGMNFYKPHFGEIYGMVNDDLGEKYVRQQGEHNGH